MVKKISTSVKVDPERWKRFKIEAIKRGVDIEDLLDEAIRKALGEEK